MMQHLGDDAELYPLGVLDDDIVREIERHIMGCVPCAGRVARARLAAASLAAALPAALPSAALKRRISEAVRAPEEARQAPDATTTPAAAGAATATASASAKRSSFAGRYGNFALAAGFALAILALAGQTLAFRARLASDDLALATIVHSHFNHVSMVPRSAHPVAAKVLYARDGSWLYIIADEPAGVVRAVAQTKRGTVELGTLSDRGRTATLFVRPAGSIAAVTLQRDGIDVASARLSL